jgi:hypothetical protein
MQVLWKVGVVAVNHGTEEKKRCHNESYSKRNQGSFAMAAHSPNTRYRGNCGGKNKILKIFPSYLSQNNQLEAISTKRGELS